MPSSKPLTITDSNNQHKYVSVTVETISEELPITGVGSGDSSLSLGNSSSSSGTLILPVSPNGKGGYIQPAPGWNDLIIPTGQRRSDSYQPDDHLGSYRISQNFKKYLNGTKGYSFRLIGTNKDGKIVKKIPYIHRWTRIYQKSILAKFYKLDEWMKDNPSVVSMFTLSTYQGSISRFNDGSYSEKIKGHRLSIGECFDLLKNSRTKLLDIIRHNYPGINYVWVLEPHETGFPHCHLVIFKEFTESEQNAIKALWTCKYQAGSIERGVKITSKNSDESILSIRNYLMKYMSKQFGTGEPWTDGELLFNAMVWDTGTRMWGASKELTAVMRKPETVSDVIWDTVELLTPGGEFEIWSRDDGDPFPVLGEQYETEQDPDDLAPESWMTKSFWKKKWDRLDPSRLQYHLAKARISIYYTEG